MSHVTVSNLAYAHPGGDLLFSDVSFHLAPGRHAALVGTNGVGKTTLKILAGILDADEGEARAGGRIGYMPQDVGLEAQARSVRELLHDGTVLALPSYDSALEAITAREPAASVRLAKQL